MGWVTYTSARQLCAPKRRYAADIGASEDIALLTLTVQCVPNSRQGPMHIIVLEGTELHLWDVLENK